MNRGVTRAWLVLVAFLVTGLAAAVDPAAATFPGRNGKIAFSRGVGEGSNITLHVEVVNEDGSGGARLTTGASPDWSADGTKIAFSRPGEGIFTVNADGSGETRVTTNRADRSPAWSPTGQIAFIRVVSPQRYDLWIVAADGTGERKLTATPSWLHLGSKPAWSPDGTKIAFARVNSALLSRTDIYVINADGSGETSITDRSFNTAPNWSPDGRRIVFTSLRDEVSVPRAGLTYITAEVYVMNADGSSPSRLTTNTTEDSTPVWSPDGRKIAWAQGFPMFDGGTPELYVMNADGSGQTRLAGTAPAEGLSWQPLAASPPPATTAGVGVAAFRLLPKAPKAGGTLTARLAAKRMDTGALLATGAVTCTATAGGRRLAVAARGFKTGAFFCTWKLPKTARRKTVKATIKVTFQGKSAQRTASKKVR